MASLIKILLKSPFDVIYILPSQEQKREKNCVYIRSDWLRLHCTFIQHFVHDNNNYRVFHNHKYHFQLSEFFLERCSMWNKVIIKQPQPHKQITTFYRLINYSISLHIDVNRLFSCKSALDSMRTLYFFSFPLFPVVRISNHSMHCNFSNKCSGRVDDE